MASGHPLGHGREHARVAAGARVALGAQGPRDQGHDGGARGGDADNNKTNRLLIDHTTTT